MSVVIETTIGDMTVDLFTEERPLACLNFLKLCKLKYYNYNLFHTIEQGFIAQTGDPTGSGDGGDSIFGVLQGPQKRFFQAENLPKIYHKNAGLISLVGAGKHLVGSQFFFTLGEDLESLDGQHCVIGEVVEGSEILRKLNEAIVDDKFRPYQDIRITHTVILDDPYADPRSFREPSRSPSPTPERLKNGRIAADEDIDDTDGKTMEEIQEMLAEREAKARATILEIVGDLPDAEMAPPENVLFVCKLNPVTTDDDLEIIFSRFGKVKTCEVIRDRKSGDSLQYAFVEFDEKKACEAAFFKMDNVLIDDRRIHVDFSQSVAKIKWRGKGRGVEGDSRSLDFNNLRSSKRENQDTRNQTSGRRRRVEYSRDRRRTRSRSRKRREISSVERMKAGEEYHHKHENRKRFSRPLSRSNDCKGSSYGEYSRERQAGYSGKYHTSKEGNGKQALHKRDKNTHARRTYEKRLSRKAGQRNLERHQRGVHSKESKEKKSRKYKKKSSPSSSSSSSSESSSETETSSESDSSSSSDDTSSTSSSVTSSSAEEHKKKKVIRMKAQNKKHEIEKHRK
ncbi:peptidyl-prolyl cis-trans isomerase sig-7 [Glossina fuscipes]|uniref:Peptidyl-prolyl cis-trans isomerase n=1 Tax=Glossina fuscipes TaxID=7396 RepID=A0A9C5Z5J1_9MUSC|nr:peptidyl-prolyl cis-trans isomerase sig-7 [Glossina fuscipes]